MICSVIIQLLNHTKDEYAACLIRIFGRMLRKTLVMNRTTIRFTFWFANPEESGLATRALLSNPIICT